MARAVGLVPPEEAALAKSSSMDASLGHIRLAFWRKRVALLAARGICPLSDVTKCLSEKCTWLHEQRLRKSMREVLSAMQLPHREVHAEARDMAAEH